MRRPEGSGCCLPSSCQKGQILCGGRFIPGGVSGAKRKQPGGPQDRNRNSGVGDLSLLQVAQTTEGGVGSSSESEDEGAGDLQQQSSQYPVPEVSEEENENTGVQQLQGSPTPIQADHGRPAAETQQGTVNQGGSPTRENHLPDRKSATGKNGSGSDQI